MGKQKRQKYKIVHLNRTIPHIAFFLARVFALLAFFIVAITDKNAKRFRMLVKLGVLKGDETNLDDTTYVFQFNIFQLYLVSYSVVNNNVYGYYLSIIVMVHNALLTSLVTAFSNIRLTYPYWLIIGIISGSFLLEALLSLYLLFLRRFENNLELFKRIGADKRINDAFSTRKFLESFGPLNVFMASVIFGKVFLPPFRAKSGSVYLVLGFTILTYIQQLFISVRFHDESKSQRRIAIMLSIIRIPVIILAMIWYILSETKADVTKRGSTAVFCYITGDLIIISLLMIFVLIKDRRRFGSGLKEFLSFGTKKINLT